MVTGAIGGDDRLTNGVRARPRSEGLPTGAVPHDPPGLHSRKGAVYGRFGRRTGNPWNLHGSDRTEVARRAW